MADHRINRLDRRIVNKTRLARLALIWEIVWPHLARLGLVVAGFIGLSWLGLIAPLPDWARFAVLAAFGIGFVWLLWQMRTLRWPSHEEAFARLERQSGLAHRPLTAISDDIAVGADAAQSTALWQAHQKQMAARLKALRAGFASPKFHRFDPYALRVVAVALLIAGYFAAGDARLQRLQTAFTGQPDAKLVAGRIDAWIAPPDYTGRPPLFLTGERNGVVAGSNIEVPESSRVVVRLQGMANTVVSGVNKNGEKITALAGDKSPVKLAGGAAAPDVRQLEFVLKADSTVNVTQTDRTLHQWQFSVVADQPPVIRLMAPPKPAETGALKLTYETKDDYGVVFAGAKFALAYQPAQENRLPLVKPPEFALTLPGGRNGTGVGETFRDLTAHPWAGAKVDMSLIARDEANKEGISVAHTFTLPERRFTRPLAKAVVEQRRKLALDANRYLDVMESLDALLVRPELFFEKPGYFLALKFTYRRLVVAGSEDDLRDVVDLMWALALTIEDGDLSLAERALRAAQDALREALEEGAGDEEIKRLTENLRKALDRYMKSMAEQMRRNPQMSRPMDENSNVLRSQDLRKLIDRIEDLARSGAKEAAKEMLAQLQHMLENLRTGRAENSPSGASRELGKMLDQLGEMIQRQRELMEQTYKYGPNANRPGQQGKEGRSKQSRRGRGEALRQLGQGQGDLRQRLEELLQGLRDMGVQRNELGQAGKSMRGAEEALGESRAGTALGRQGEALNQLRSGAQGLIQELLGMRRDEAGRHDPNSREDDPLGRPRQTEGPDFGPTTKVPDEIDIQRARRILKELRRRLGEAQRPQLERDYLERLLERF